MSLGDQTEQLLDDVAQIIELGGGGGGHDVGQVRAFVFDNTHQRVVWQPEETIAIRAIHKCPGSSIDLVVSLNDLSKVALLSLSGGTAPVHQIVYYDGDGTTSSHQEGMNVWIYPNLGDKIYFNWLTSSWGLVLVYFDYVNRHS